MKRTKPKPKPLTWPEVIRAAYCIRKDKDGTPWGPAFLWHRYPYPPLDPDQLVIRGPGGALLATLRRAQSQMAWIAEAEVGGGGSPQRFAGPDMLRLMERAEKALLLMAAAQSPEVTP